RDVDRVGRAVDLQLQRAAAAVDPPVVAEDPRHHRRGRARDGPGRADPVHRDAERPAAREDARRRGAAGEGGRRARLHRDAGGGPVDDHLEGAGRGQLAAVRGAGDRGGRGAVDGHGALDAIDREHEAARARQRAAGRGAPDDR
ncbi:MAG: hypothetical protein ACK559_25365, partial [bacterium]